MILYLIIIFGITTLLILFKHKTKTNPIFFTLSILWNLFLLYLSFFGFLYYFAEGKNPDALLQGIIFGILLITLNYFIYFKPKK